MEMKLFASLIILLTCQVLHSRGEPSPNPQDVNLYLFLPNANEGKSGQRAASVESEKGSSVNNSTVETEKDNVEQSKDEEQPKGSDYAADFEDVKKEESNDKDGEEFEYINNIHIEGDGGAAYGGGGG